MYGVKVNYYKFSKFPTDNQKRCDYFNYLELQRKDPQVLC